MISFTMPNIVNVSQHRWNTKTKRQGSRVAENTDIRSNILGPLVLAPYFSSGLIHQRPTIGMTTQQSDAVFSSLSTGASTNSSLPISLRIGPLTLKTQNRRKGPLDSKMIFGSNAVIGVHNSPLPAGVMRALIWAEVLKSGNISPGFTS